MSESRVEAGPDDPEIELPQSRRKPISIRLWSVAAPARPLTRRPAGIRATRRLSICCRSDSLATFRVTRKQAHDACVLLPPCRFGDRRRRVSYNEFTLPTHPDGGLAQNVGRRW